MYAAKIYSADPTPPTTNVVDGIFADVVGFGDVARPRILCKECSDLYDLTRGQFCIAVSFSLRAFWMCLEHLTAFGRAVAHVVYLVTFEKMIPASTSDGAAVANMECERFRPSPMCQKKGDSVHQVFSVFDRDDSVTVVQPRPRPNPTRAQLRAMGRDRAVPVNLRFESLGERSDAISAAKPSTSEERGRFVLPSDERAATRSAKSWYLVFHRSLPFSGRSRPRPVARRGDIYMQASTISEAA